MPFCPQSCTGMGSPWGASTGCVGVRCPLLVRLVWTSLVQLRKQSTLPLNRFAYSPWRSGPLGYPKSGVHPLLPSASP